MISVLMGCSTEEGLQPDPSRPSLPPAQDERGDIDPIALVGIDANELNSKLFAPSQLETSFGDGNLRDLGNGVLVATEGLNFSRRVNPDRGDEFSSYTGDFKILTACSRFDEDDEGYYLYVGFLPPELATDEVIARGKAGEFNDILQERTGCEAWGPTIPVSRAAR